MDPESYSLSQPPKELCKIVVVTAVCFIIVTLLHVLLHGDEDNAIYYASLVPAVLMAVCGVGVAKKIAAAYWLSVVFSALLIVFGIVNICVTASWLSIPSYHSTWALGIYEVVVGAVALAYLVDSRGNVLNKDAAE